MTDKSPSSFRGSLQPKWEWWPEVRGQQEPEGRVFRQEQPVRRYFDADVQAARQLAERTAAARREDERRDTGRRDAERREVARREAIRHAWQAERQEVEHRRQDRGGGCVVM